MPKLRAATSSRVTVRGQSDDYQPTRHSVTTRQDRMRLIHECLRDLAGVELIYAIRCTDGLIKIGWTQDLMSRRRHFASSDAPEAILAIQPGTYEQEQALHQQLASSLARGKEYYHPTEQVLSLVNAIRSRLGADALAA
jgi:hypothetical protein